MKHMTMNEYRDRVKGCWFGKCFGGASGAPYEGFKHVIEYSSLEEIVRPDLPNDDLDIQLLWVEVLQKKGLNIDSKDLADAWIKSCPYTMSEYGYFIKNYERGILPPASGWFNNNFFKVGNGCPIRAEIWGLVFFNDGETAAGYARLDGTLDHAGESVWIEQFYAVMVSMSFSGKPLHQLIEIARKYLPEGSEASRCVTSVLSCYIDNPDDYQSAREVMLRLFGHHDFTYSVINMAFVLISLLYGKGDIRKTVEIGLHCGYDTDCTCATAAALIGAITGYEDIPESIKKMIGNEFVASVDLERTDFTIDALTDDVCALGILFDESRKEPVLSESRPVLKRARSLYSSNPKRITICAQYIGDPCIGFTKKGSLSITIRSSAGKSEQVWIQLSGISGEFELSWDKQLFQIDPDQPLSVTNEIAICDGVEKVRSFVDLTIEVAALSGNILARENIGFATADSWHLAGPYFEMFPDPVRPEDYPSAHGPDSDLPSLEGMVNNHVLLDSEYIDEIGIDEAVMKNATLRIDACEDLLPRLPAGYIGQACFYLTKRIYVPTDRRVWVVIGNTDAFSLWVNGTRKMSVDENRIWTPYNNSMLIDLAAGGNTITLKLLRRTSDFSFSLGLRAYEGKHWHQQKWLTDVMPMR